jgi:Fe-coproporphyrin III synthase
MAMTSPNDGCELLQNPSKGLNVVHIHPTLRCNLACKHCYSSSAPHLKDGISVDQFKPFLEYAFTQGFDVVSISGGEPFLYADLQELLAFTKSIGYKNQVATNGMLLQSAKAQACLKYIDLIAISIDGRPDRHDFLRGMKGAFQKMEQGIQILQQYQKTFGIIHTIVDDSWQDLLWLSEYAVAKGAKLLQLHPLEMYGRAIDEMQGHALSEDSLHRVNIIGNWLKVKLQDILHVQMDFLHRDYILENPEAIHYFGEDYKIPTHGLADFLRTVVIDENGAIVPVSYGFSKEYQIGNINAETDFQGLFSHYINTKGNALYQLFERVFQNIVSENDKDLIPWTELVVRTSNYSKSLMALT